MLKVYVDNQGRFIFNPNHNHIPKFKIDLVLKTYKVMQDEVFLKAKIIILKKFQNGKPPMLLGGKI